ncbi:hypothetical protein ACJJTC_001916 [Scirpophaga incertulas]
MEVILCSNYVLAQSAYELKHNGLSALHRKLRPTVYTYVYIYIYLIPPPGPVGGVLIKKLQRAASTNFYGDWNADSLNNRPQQNPRSNYNESKDNKGGSNTTLDLRCSSSALQPYIGVRTEC